MSIRDFRSTNEFLFDEPTWDLFSSIFITEVIWLKRNGLIDLSVDSSGECIVLFGAAPNILFSFSSTLVMSVLLGSLSPSASNLAFSVWLD